MARTQRSDINKLFISNISQVIYSVEVYTSDFSIRNISIVSIEDIIMQKNAFITDYTKLLTIKVVN